MVKKLSTVTMWVFRRMLRISSTENKTEHGGDKKIGLFPSKLNATLEFNAASKRVPEITSEGKMD